MNDRKQYCINYYAKNREKILQKSKDYYYSDGRYKNAFNARRTIESRYKMGKSNAKRKNIEWNISLEEYSLIIEKDVCSYCEGPLEKAGNCLDRKDSNLGYLISNVTACCKRCNYLKGNWLSSEETKEVTNLLKQLRQTKNIWAESK